MSILTPISTGVGAFAATNLDDLVILILFFSQVNSQLRRHHIVYGQYLGFTLLILASLPGFFGGFMVPRSWIGLLGTVPIVIGISRLFELNSANLNEHSSHETEDFDSTVELPTKPPADLSANLPTGLPAASQLARFFSPQACGVAALTVANGSDNLSVYVPLFASCNWQSLALVLTVFFLLIGIWCYAAERLIHLPTVTNTLARYGNQLVPYGLIGLGGLILWNSETLANRGLTVIALLICVGYLNYLQNVLLAAEIEEN